MKRVCFLVFVCIFFLASANAEEMILTGYYTGKNLYVQNPILPDNKSFSTEQVFVNESLVLTNPITSAFIIDLSHLSVDQTVEVRIIHKQNFLPKIINAYVIRDRQLDFSKSFAAVKQVFRWTKADQKTIRWLTFGEKGGGTFDIQKAFRESWETISQVPSKTLDDKSVYKVLVTHDHGDNTYRLKLVDRDGYVSYSPLINYKVR